MAGAGERGPTFPVEFALIVQRRDLVAHCCFPEPKRVHIGAGDPIEFIRPDGTVFQTTVQAIDLVHDASPGLIGIRLSKNVQKDDIPVGTTVRLVKADDL